MRAWAQIHHRAPQLNVIVGGVEPEARRRELRELALSLGVSSSVTVLGSMSHDEYLDHIASARAAICCSSLEAFSLPVAEALAIGAPVLSSAIPAHVELTHRASAGELFPVDDVDALASRMARLLEGDLPARMSCMPEEWSWSYRAAQHVEAYQRYVQP